MFDEWSVWVMKDSADKNVEKSMVLASSVSYSIAAAFMLMFAFGY
jgi:alpha-L-arabinofuranosidase